MKKALALLSLILSVLLLTGCGLTDMMGCGGNTVDPIVSPKPWSNSTDYEYISYGLTRYCINNIEGTTNYTYGDKEAEGEFSTTLVTISENIYNSAELDVIKARSEYFTANIADRSKNMLSASPGTYSVLYTDYTLTYNNTNTQFSGKTDKMTSVVLFKTASLEPAFSEKVTTSETTDYSYSAIADYVGGTNLFTTNGNTVSTSINGGASVFDNELLYYVVRASSGLTAGGSAAITAHNSVYTGINNKETVRNMYFAANASLALVSGIDPDQNGFISKYFASNEVEYYPETKLTEDGQTEYFKGYALPSYYVNLQLNEQNRGLVRSLFYATSGFNYVGDTTSNVLLQTIDFENDENGNLIYATVGLIDDYKTSRLM